MKFYDRENELATLEKILLTRGSNMIIVSGRRRIGKSRLINEFLFNKESATILVVPKEEKLVAADFAVAMAVNGYIPTFNKVEEALEYFFVNFKKAILFIDEFPNLLDVASSIPFVFQRVWEKYKDSTSKVLIFSGSYVSMMNKIFTKQKAPLFNRASAYIVLQPLSLKTVWQIQEDLGVDPIEKISNYCLLGGVPYYYELIEKRGKADAVKDLFFDIAAPLREEGLNVLRQEFGSAYKKYFSIIEAIGAGVVSGSEVANRLGVAQTTLSKYIVSLQRDFQLVERTVPYGQNLQKSKKGVYAIKDNTIAFWFALVYGKQEPPSADKLNEFISKRFEVFCRDFLVQYLKAKGETVVWCGRWWGHAKVDGERYENREIDVVVETNTSVYVGECKWTNKKARLEDLRCLEESSLALKTGKPIKKVLFSKRGFNFSQADAMLFDPSRIDMEISKLL
ncbi:MAG: ATP-binding protein [Candidatus Bathyarchaeota archaeon]|nr:ATP-binding protein [Candidatus Bathyarchaeota archaeon]